MIPPSHDLMMEWHRSRSERLRQLAGARRRRPSVDALAAESYIRPAAGKDLLAAAGSRPVAQAVAQAPATQEPATQAAAAQAPATQAAATQEPAAHRGGPSEPHPGHSAGRDHRRRELARR